MDPKATLWEALEALTKGDRVEAMSLLLSYYEWRINGGFEPTLRDERYHCNWEGDKLASAMRETLKRD